MHPIPLLTALLVTVATPALADRETVTCSGVRVTLETDSARDWQDICPVLARGREIMAKLGLQLPKALRLSFQRKPYSDRVCQTRCIGYYDGHNKKLYLPGYKTERRLQQQEALFTGELTSGIWESYLIHELAHATAQQEASPGRSLCIASEYIASVAQILSLTTADRNRLLQRYDLAGFSGDRDITLTYYLIDPGKFSVNSYLHYHKLPDGPAFVRQILSSGLDCDN